MNHDHNDETSPAPQAAAQNPFVDVREGGIRSTQDVRPTPATVLAVVGAILGILGLLSSLAGLLNTFFSRQLASMFNQGGPFQDAQTEMNEKMAAVLANYFIPNLLLSIAGIVLFVLLVSGAVGLLTGKAWSRNLLRRVLLLLIIYEVIRLVAYGLMQMEIMPITREYMERIADADTNSPGGQFVSKISGIMMVVGVVMWSGWFSIKIAMMIWARRYLGKNHLDEYFASKD